MKFYNAFLSTSLLTMILLFGMPSGYAGMPVKKSTKENFESVRKDKVAPTPAEQTEQTNRNLEMMRAQIDELDSQLLQLLAKRLLVTNAIGEYKKANNIAVVQPNRYEEILAKQIKQGAELGIDGNFVKIIMDAIHDESVRQQSKILNK